MSGENLEHRNGRVIMKIRCSEFVDDDNGGHFIHTMREQDVTEFADRPNDLCKLCGFPTYPECREWCSNEKKSRE